MISCEIGQMNSGGQSDGTTLSLDGDLEESPSTGTSEKNQKHQQTTTTKTTHVVDEQN